MLKKTNWRKWWQAIPTAKKQLGLLIVFLGLILGFYYLSCLPIFTPDSTEYYAISRVIVGDLPITRWWELRGPTFPLVVALITQIFGDSPVGFLVGSFIVYLFFIGAVWLVLREVLKLITNQINKVFVVILVIGLIIFNPILIGYSHAMLTELLAIPLAMLSFYLALKWAYFQPQRKTWIQAVLYVLAFLILSLSAWLLKQPYLTLAILPLLGASVISLVRVKGWQNLVYRLVGVVVVFGFTFSLSSVWNNYLCSQKQCLKEYESGHYLNKGLVDSATSFRAIAVPEAVGKTHKVYGVHNYKGEMIDRIVISKQEIASESSTQEALKTLAIFAKKHPVVFMRSYLFNYWATIDFMNTIIVSQGGVYHFVPLFDNILQTGGENYSLSYSAYEDRSIVWWDIDQRPPGLDFIKHYGVQRHNNKLVKLIYKLVGGPFQFLFVMVFLFLPVLFLVSLYRFFKTIKQKTTKSVLLNDVVLLLSGVSFLHVLSNVLTGAIIDRYISPVLSLTLLATIIFVSQLFRQKQVLGKAPRQTNEKLLFVIPAYNEADSIAKVIADINKHLPEADIVVVNDNSKDDTAKLARQAGAVVLDMPFNVRYAMAVQTGIKYALANNYGYVIQFDADGQHLASEAKKMFTEMKRSQVDIVLGSRFLEKTDYPHALVRVIGTKVNSSMVELLSGQKITDPTSGLQCLNRRVIEKYARMGEYPEYPDANLIVEMLLKGYQIKEVAVQMKARETGESMHSGVWKPLKYAIKVSYAIFIITLRQIEIRRNK